MNTARFFTELKSQNLSRLEKQAGVSRQALHGAIKTKNMRLDNLQAVAKALNYSVEVVPHLTEENLLSSLVQWGAPLAHSKGGNLSLEWTLAEALKKARVDGLYESVVPYVLSINVDRLHPELLVGLAYQNEQVNVLGYFVEAANHFRPHAKLGYVLKLLEAGKRPNKEPLVLSTKLNFPELFQKNKLALKWNLWVRGDFADHLSRWEKWDRSQKKS
jgi:hypothetical protein